MQSSTEDIPLHIESLSVRYGNVLAVQSLSLNVIAGECVGLLGPNGAGKSSTVASIVGMGSPASGTIRVFGNPPGSLSARERLSFVPEVADPPLWLSGQEYLRFISRAYGTTQSDDTERIRLWLDRMELPPKKRVSTYSLGMRRRLVLAQAFLSKAPLLILDEPLNGLDPLMIIRLRDWIREHCTEGGSAVLCSHILSEIQQTCTSVLVLHRGRVVLQGKTPEIVSAHGSIEAAFTKAIESGGV